MKRPPRVSVVVVSRDRPAELKLCLTALGQLVDADYEIICVTNLAGIEAISELGLEDRIKLVPFEEANISAARNAGIAAAAGEIVAFIDDDAVPEPTWLFHLAMPFEDPDVEAAGGFVRGRNGISFQWKARDIRTDGQSEPLAVDEHQPTLLTPPLGRGVKTEGTNMAVRRDVLAEIGGFDPAFLFYLDESDLNLRLSKRRTKTAIVPLAQVHHGFAPSRLRRPDRAPKDLTQIGASFAVFLRKHHDESLWSASWTDFQAEQRKRCLSHMVAGRLDPVEVTRLMASLRAGWAKGFRRHISSLSKIPKAAQGFKPFERMGATGWHRTVAGSPIAARRLVSEAKQAVAQGDVATVMRFSATGLYHRVRFHPDGYWLQTGGRWGKSDRSDSFLQMISMKSRISREEQRISGIRFLESEQ